MEIQQFLQTLIDKDDYIDMVELCDKGAIVPIYWTEDSKGNINFDLDSIRQQFETLMDCLEQHNDSSEFDWDAI